jgi:hypothetical protein
MSNVEAAAAAVNDPAKITSVHEAAVADIVGMIRATYQEEGDRNFAIGKRAFEHAQWQKGNFPGYKGSDFDNLMNRLRDEVRVFVAINPKSIKVGEWVRCHVLRSCVAAAAGADIAESLSFAEYRVIYGEALSFHKEDVFGELKPGWLDFVKAVAFDRAQPNGRVSTDEFLARFDAHKKCLEAAAAAKADPAAAAAKAASDAIKAKTRAVAKANEDITSAMSDALAAGHLTSDQILALLENVSKHHQVAMPSKVGFDPAGCTVADCDLLASTMFQAGKYAEMKHLRDKLDQMVAAVDKAAKAARKVA